MSEKALWPLYKTCPAQADMAELSKLIKDYMAGAGLAFADVNTIAARAEAYFESLATHDDELVGRSPQFVEYEVDNFLPLQMAITHGPEDAFFDIINVVQISEAEFNHICKLFLVIV